MPKNHLHGIALLGLFFLTPCLYAQEVIQNLHSRDATFKQLQQEIEENYRRAATGKELLPVTLFVYRTRKTDTLYSIAARLNIPYDAIATLNGWSSPWLFPHDEIIYLPNMPGLAIQNTETDDFLRAVQQRLTTQSHIDIELPANAGQKGFVTFYPLQRFTGAERAQFLTGFFCLPTKQDPLVITSGFGRRPNPFHKNRWEMHTGIDYRSSLGSGVYAARFGRVVRVAESPILGLYIIIQHEKKYQTVYGHLQRVLVQPGDKIKTGQKIALSGNSGRSSGPHLHFEIRHNQKSIDPIPFLKKH